jgi:hypothetical protein
VHVLDSIATPNGEVGISGSRSSPCQMSPIIGIARRAQREQPIIVGIVVYNFNSNFKSHQRPMFFADYETKHKSSFD